jgi:hypothetical protein
MAGGFDQQAFVLLKQRIRMLPGENYQNKRVQRFFPKLEGMWCER